MANWIERPRLPLIWQKDQQEFLAAHRLRHCPKCDADYNCPPHTACPRCAVVGNRVYDRLTIIAGRRFGKSRIGAIAGVEEATVPNSIGWACAPTNPKLHRYVIPAFQEIIPRNLVKSFDKDHLDLWLTNDSLIHFQTLEDPDQGRGQGLDWLWIDEVCELTKTHWEVIRPSLAGDTVAFFTTSPRGRNWVYKELYLPYEEGTPGYLAWKAKTSDSKNPKITPEFLAREKAQMSPEMYRQEYEADFVSFQGAVYGSMLLPQILPTDEDVKRIIPEWPAIAPWRQVTMGLDSGAKHPFGAVKLVSTEQGLVVVGEYLQQDRSFMEHSQAIKRLAASDSARFGLNKNERTAMIELAQHGILNCTPSPNDVVAGIERVKSLLHQRLLWFALPRCPKTVEEMVAYRWAEDETSKGEILKERVFKLNDELPDCIRYACMAFPPPVQSAPVETKERNISNLPEKMQQDIQTLRRLTKMETGKELSKDSTFVEGAPDFWGNSTSDWNQI